MELGVSLGTTRGGYNSLCPLDEGSRIGAGTFADCQSVGRANHGSELRRRAAAARWSERRGKWALGVGRSRTRMVDSRAGGFGDGNGESPNCMVIDSPEAKSRRQFHQNQIGTQCW
jgi:hypothetical protein